MYVCWVWAERPGMEIKCWGLEEEQGVIWKKVNVRDCRTPEQLKSAFKNILQGI